MSTKATLLVRRASAGMSNKVKLSALLASAAMLTVAGLPSTAQAADPTPEEVFGVTTVISVPNLGTNTSGLNSFDISFVDAASGFYLLSDRSNKAVDVVDTNTNTLHAQYTVTPGFAGSVLCPPPPAGSGAANDCAGPDGNLVANGNQIWVGDGNSQVWVLNLNTGATIAGPIITALSGVAGTDPTRADELCWDSKDQIIMIANDASSPSPFVTFISSKKSTLGSVLGHIVMDGTKGTPNATGGIEQCQWSSATGQFYVNIPNPASNPNDGLVLQIDPVSETIKNTFSLAGSGCNGNAGMALGPSRQALLGCSNAGPNSLIINIKTGAIIAKLAGDTGADEVWYNPGDNQYFMGNGNRLAPGTTSPSPQLGVVDPTKPREDFSPASAVGSHSVAADPVFNQVYVPVNGTTGAASGICQKGNSDTPGCIAVFTVIRGKDDPKAGTCVAAGAPVTAMNGNEPQTLKVACPR
jgi:hypothetical protein